MNDENEPLLIGDFITSIKIERVFDLNCFFAMK